MSSFSEEKNSNLPPRMRHKFKMRNPKREFHTQPEDDIEMMANNLLKLQREITEEFQSSEEEIRFDEKEEISEENGDENDEELGKNEAECSLYPTNRNEHEKLNETEQKEEFLTKEVSIKEKLEKNYEEYLSSNTFSSNYEEKINELLDSENEIMSIGNAIALFEMVYYFKEILTKEILHEIQSKAFQSIIALEENADNDSVNEKCLKKNSNDELMKIAYAELIAICGITSQEIVGYYLHEIIENPSSFEQSFNVLINMGVYGLVTLIKIVNEDFEELSKKVLKKLSKSDLIISKIIVPQIYSDLVSVSSSTKDKNTALFLLSKIGSIAHSEELMEILLSLFKSHSIDKNLLISAIVSTGNEESEKIIISLLKQPNISEYIAVFIIKSLSISSNIHKKMKLKVEICEYSVVDLLQINKLYFYEGPIKSYFSDDKENLDSLFVNSRMLMSLAEKYVIDKENEEMLNESLNNETQSLKEFILSEIIAKEEKEELPNLEVINLFLTLLERTKEKIAIKSALIEALGNIALPENPIEVIEKLINYLFSSDPSLLSTTCLTLSKFEFIPSAKVVQRLRELLKHNLWKVRISACQAIGSILREPVDNVLDALRKCLKDGSINRELVCQTLLKIHPVCEELLVEILKSSKDTKIQEIILCSFNENQTLLSDNFLKILETIFDFSKNQKREIRYICLGVVSSLRRLSTEKNIELNHFKDRNILPFYYNFLSDSCSEIRDLALNLILDFGSYADLILIEGMTKGQLKCKIECAKGLGMRGVHNFRALLLGMRDMNEKVRQKSCISILENFEVQEIIEEYQYQESQCISLDCKIKDLIKTGENLGQEIKIFLSQLMCRLSENITDFKFEEIDEDKEIEKEINEFKQGMKLKNKVQESLSTNIDYESQDIENINPNIFVSVEKEKNQKVTKTPFEFLENQENKKANIRTNNSKKYYFKLNQVIEN